MLHRQSPQRWGRTSTGLTTHAGSRPAVRRRPVAVQHGASPLDSASASSLSDDTVTSTSNSSIPGSKPASSWAATEAGGEAGADYLYELGNASQVNLNIDTGEPVFEIVVPHYSKFVVMQTLGTVEITVQLRTQ